MHQSLWPYFMTLANFLHPLLPPHKSNSHIVILRKSPSALSAMGVFFLLLLEILCKPFSLPFVLRREALSLTKTSSSENNRSPRLSLNLLSVAFLPRSVANELICLSGFWPTQLWQEVKKVLPCYRSGWPRSLSQGYQCTPSKRQLDL